MSKIKKVIAKDDYQLEVQLENGCSVLLDFSRRLNTVRFGMFTDIDFFMKAEIDGDCIRWDDKIEISLSEVFGLARR